ncbi:MAG: Na+-driven multidrug efflux protein [Cytophagales bacterium]|jgi:putative MATE family efflux protein|nr:MATE family efflux transporter [Bacteroidota bacterium]MBS1982401.1 MATE family efflux transporter [Bacteroidota bacterium]WHZ06664.1 MAG: Na+-driven multidrug efflux protein [Cytophagales bacterium]
MNFFSRIQSFFRLFIKAIKGDEQNFTEGSINRAIFLLSVPMILEMAMESVFAVVDIFFVSRLNNSDAVAVIGLTESLLAIVYSVAWGISMGATALVARRVGEKDNAGAAVAGVQAIWTGAAFSVLISGAGIFFYEDLLRLMGASDAVIASGSGFTQWMLTGNMTIMMLFLINGIFRGAGNAAIAMRVLWVANLFNIVLDPILIFGLGPIPAFGVEGAAISTNIGRGIGVIIQLYYLFSGKSIVKLSAQNFKIDWKIIWQVVEVSAGGTGQFLISSASWVFLSRIIAQFGSTAIAGYTIALRVIVFTILPSWGMANAAATLVGQNLGANQPERAEKSVWKTGFYNMVFLALIMIVFLFFSSPILRFFTSDTQVVNYGTQCLQIVALGYLFYGYGMVITQSFNGAGDTKTPTLLNLFGFWCFQIPLAYALAIYLDWGPNGVYAAIAIAESAIAVAGIILFRKGKWKTVKV